MPCQMVATRPGHDADASRKPARSYAHDLDVQPECSRETARRPLACMGVQIPPEDRGATQRLGQLLRPRALRVRPGRTPALGHHVPNMTRHRAEDADVDRLTSHWHHKLARHRTTHTPHHHVDPTRLSDPHRVPSLWAICFVLEICGNYYYYMYCTTTTNDNLRDLPSGS